MGRHLWGFLAALRELVFLWREVHWSPLTSGDIEREKREYRSAVRKCTELGSLVYIFFCYINYRRVINILSPQEPAPTLSLSRKKQTWAYSGFVRDGVIKYYSFVWLVDLLVNNEACNWVNVRTRAGVHHIHHMNILNFALRSGYIDSNHSIAFLKKFNSFKYRIWVTFLVWPEVLADFGLFEFQGSTCVVHRFRTGSHIRWSFFLYIILLQRNATK